MHSSSSSSSKDRLSVEVLLLSFFFFFFFVSLPNCLIIYLLFSFDLSFLFENERCSPNLLGFKDERQNNRLRVTF